MNYFPLYIGDYLRDTRELTPTQHGIYFLLLMQCYATERPITRDKPAVYRMVGATSDEERRACDGVLEKFFVFKADGWHNPRVPKVIKKIVQAQEAGRKGGLATQHGGDQDHDPDDKRNAKRSLGESLGDSLASGRQASKTKTKTKYKTKTKSQNQSPEEEPCGGGLVEPAPAPTARQAAVAATWDAYRRAFAARYGTPPVRNARVNAQLCQFVDRIGFEESPGVAAFFVGHPDSFYVRKLHPVGNLLADAEKLRAEWATDRRMTGTEARLSERGAATAAAFQELIDEAERGIPLDPYDIRTEDLPPEMAAAVRELEAEAEGTPLVPALRAVK